MNRLTTAAARLGARLQSRAGIAGTYSRGAAESEELTAVVAAQEYEVTNDEGLPTRVLMYDWTFTAAELVVSGSAIEPRPGDRWTVDLEGNEEIYEVLPVGDRPHFERLDSSGVLIVIHTKRVA